MTSILVAITLLSGSVLAEKSAISDSQFVMLYVDLSVAAEQFLSDSVYLAQIQDSIFEAHSVTREQFDIYKLELDKSPERWSEIWQMVATELDKREEALKKRKVNVTTNRAKE